MTTQSKSTFILKQLFNIYLYKTQDRKVLEEYIENTFYAVYKLKNVEEDKENPTHFEFGAEELLQEDFREPEKIEYFNNYTI